MYVAGRVVTVLNVEGDVGWDGGLLRQEQREVGAAQAHFH